MITFAGWRHATLALLIASSLSSHALTAQMNAARDTAESHNHARLFTAGDAALAAGIAGLTVAMFPIDKSIEIWHVRQADGSMLSRATGYAILHAAGTETTDEVVFGESGDLVLLGARTLEGMNLRVEPVGKRLVDAGPAPAAAGAF